MYVWSMYTVLQDVSSGRPSQLVIELLNQQREETTIFITHILTTLQDTRSVHTLIQCILYQILYLYIGKRRLLYLMLWRLLYP